MNPAKSIDLAPRFAHPSPLPPISRKVGRNKDLAVDLPGNQAGAVRANSFVINGSFERYILKKYL